MRKLSPPPEPRWETLQPAGKDLPAVEALFAPITDRMREKASRASRVVMLAAPEHVREELAAALKTGNLAMQPLSPEAADLLRDVGDQTSRELIRLGLIDWKGLGGPGDDDDPIAVSPESIGWFLADEDLFRKAEEVYVTPDALRQAEKNGLSGSPAGTSKGATPAKDIASGSVRHTKKAGASLPRKPTMKKPARAARTS